MNKKSDTPTASLSRRRVLRRAAGALPVVLTLPSGAALARSSNLLSTATDSPESAFDAEGLLCLDTRFVDSVEDGKVDLGESGEATVYRLPSNLEYRRDESGSAITPAEVCVEGGTFVAADPSSSAPEWTSYTLPGSGLSGATDGGVLVSATALSSFASTITDFRDVLDV